MSERRNKRKLQMFYKIQNKTFSVNLTPSCSEFNLVTIFSDSLNYHLRRIHIIADPVCSFRYMTQKYFKYENNYRSIEIYYDIVFLLLI